MKNPKFEIGAVVKTLVDPSGACIEQSLIGTYGIILEIDKCGTLRVDDWWYSPKKIKLVSFKEFVTCVPETILKNFIKIKINI